MAKSSKAAAHRGADARRDALVAQRAVNEAGSVSRQATAKFHRVLDAHMRGNADAGQVMVAARAMWKANQELRRLETKHAMKARKTAPSGGAGGSGPKARSRLNLFGVRTVLPGSFEGGKRR